MIRAISALADNYIWIYENDGQAFIVDPGESQGVLADLASHHLTLVGILLTHNHDDHTGGVEKIREEWPTVKIYGPQETNQWNTHTVLPGETIQLLGNSLQVILTAGHTNGHISYLMDQSLFCADALFSGGCGRVFTGDYEAEYQAMQYFNTLGNDVKVYAAHEYTVQNLRFAETVEKENKEVKIALEQAKKCRQLGEPTLPSTIGKEKQINPFLRASHLAEFIQRRKSRDNWS